MLRFTRQARVYDVFIKLPTQDRHDLLLLAQQYGVMSDAMIEERWNDPWTRDFVLASSYEHAREIMEDTFPNLLDLVIARTKNVVLTESFVSFENA